MCLFQTSEGCLSIIHLRILGDQWRNKLINLFSLPLSFLSCSPITLDFSSISFGSNFYIRSLFSSTHPIVIELNHARSPYDPPEWHTAHTRHTHPHPPHVCLCLLLGTHRARAFIPRTLSSRQSTHRLIEHSNPRLRSFTLSHSLLLLLLGLALPNLLGSITQSINQSSPLSYDHHF